MRFNIISILTIVMAISDANGSWNSPEMQMFDLVEELKMNFYDFLKVSETASLADIKRAYRKLSITMHPDRNTEDPQAEAKFRQLVGVYEVLKDETLRESYNHVLRDGLPTWRSSAFYYRKLRKMSNAELFGMFALLSTAVHYAVLWGSRFEKSLILDSQLRTSLKAHKARDRKREAIELEIAKKLSQIPRPKWHDLLPFAIFKGCYHCAVFLIDLGKYLKYYFTVEVQKILEDRREKSEQKNPRADRAEKKRPLISEDLSDVYSEQRLHSSGYESDRDADDETDNGEHLTHRNNWTESDLSKLVEAVSRFPGGARNRWENIANFVGRPVTDVIKKAKQLGEGKAQPDYYKNSFSETYSCFETNMNAVCGESSSEGASESEDENTGQILNKGSAEEPESSNSSNDKADEAQPLAEMEREDDESQPYMSRKKLKQQRLAETKAASSERASAAQAAWTQQEQKQLEMAIRSIPKDLPDRWDQIASCVPTKSKLSVINRVKQLSSMKRGSAN